MAIRKVKISELPLEETLKGLHTIGVNSKNESVKVSLEFVEEAADRANMAADGVETVTAAAREATQAANTAATAATKQAKAAETAAGKADTEATKATKATEATNAATKKAEAATTAATQAAANANAAADRVDESITDITAEKKAAQDAAALANEKAGAADTAAGRVNEAITQANTARDNAEEAAGNADGATQAAEQKLAQMNEALQRMEELEKTLVAKDRMQPQSLTVEYPERITKGNTDTEKLRVKATLLPAGTGGNVLFLGDDNAVSVFPDGFLTVNRAGISRIHVIPTENTSIYKTILITVTEPALRLVKAGSLRFTGNGNIRLT